MEVDVAAKTDTRSGGDVSEDGKHRHTAVLELDLTKAVKAVLPMAEVRVCLLCVFYVFKIYDTQKL